MGIFLFAHKVSVGYRVAILAMTLLLFVLQDTVANGKPYNLWPHYQSLVPMSETECDRNAEFQVGVVSRPQAFLAEIAAACRLDCSGYILLNWQGQSLPGLAACLKVKIREILPVVGELAFEFHGERLLPITNDEIETLCQRCAKQTKSNVVYPMCCKNTEEAREWCQKYINFGLQ